MEMRLYSFLDTKSRSFSQPFVLPNDAEAERGLLALCADAESKFAVYPEDYELWFLGVLDDKSGILSSTAPEKILTALAAKDEITERVKNAKRLLSNLDDLTPAETIQSLQTDLVTLRSELTRAHEQLAAQAKAIEGSAPSLSDVIKSLEN